MVAPAPFCDVYGVPYVKIDRGIPTPLFHLIMLGRLAISVDNNLASLSHELDGITLVCPPVDFDSRYSSHVPPYVTVERRLSATTADMEKGIAQLMPNSNPTA
jgi:hypothetical protein